MSTYPSLFEEGEKSPVFQNNVRPVLDAIQAALERHARADQQAQVNDYLVTNLVDEAVRLIYECSCPSCATASMRNMSATLIEMAQRWESEHRDDCCDAHASETN